MSDLYRELLIKRVPQPSDMLKKVGMIVLTLMAAGAVIFTPWAAIALLVMGVLDYFFLPSFHLEYEYLYVNGELDVDKIISKSKRKRAASYRMEDMEMIAPWHSHEMDYYRNGHKGKMTDFSSGRKDAKPYAMVYGGEKGTEIVLLELDQIILEDIRRIAPRKVKVG